MADLLHRARKAKAALPPSVPLEPSELQERVARDVGRITQTEVDPLTVVEHGYEHPYYPVSVTVDDFEFRGSYLWGGRDQRHHHAGELQARRAKGRRRKWVYVRRLADLADA